MKFNPIAKRNLLTLVAALGIVASSGAAENLTDPLEILRSTYQLDRQALLADALQLTESERAAFWPLYQSYRADMENLGDSLVKLVLEYRDVYPDVPEKRAESMLKQYVDLEKNLVNKRAWYLKRAGKILSATKILRWAQLENRMDLTLRLQLASVIPLAPIEGELTGTTTTAAAMEPGVPGGIVVQTHELTATVTAIDPGSRKVTLLSADGIKQTVRVGPEAVNFDQIRVGDRLTVMVAEELVVYVAGEGESPSGGAAQMVALAPKGAKPGGIMAQTTQVTATVTTIDLEHHQATLRFEDGSSRTVAVRPDVDLGKRKVGDHVVVRITEAVAIDVKQP